MSDSLTLEGGCACGVVRYRLLRQPMTVHCCHCRWCQRETGSAFVINAMIESDQLETLDGDPELIETPSESGHGQKVVRCPECKVALWSHYAGAGESISFLRVGTLDEPDNFPPEIHVFVSSKQAWLELNDGKPAFDEFYSLKEVWPAESLARIKAVKG
ncbi:MAG: hypothetical protein ACI9H8_001832 [Lysobacterales bacterium]|jgi:hypothetical protein